MKFLTAAAPALAISLHSHSMSGVWLKNKEQPEFVQISEKAEQSIYV